MKARLPKGVGAGQPNMQHMIKQAQKMQEDMTNLQEDLDAREYDVNAGGGVVTVKITGQLEIKNIELDEDIVDPDDIETLQDILTAAVNEAIKTVTTTNNEEMGKITGSLNMPGIPGLF
jgi:DNA-binding YbaB/EbfC family protein